MKTNRCRTTGLDSRSHHLSATVNTNDVVDLVVDLSNDDSVDGILVQHAMPAHIDERGVFEAIPAGKDVDPAGRHLPVIGRSPILGKPVGMLLLARDATVTYRHSRTTNLATIVGQADIVVAAVGQPELVKGAWVKPGAVVIDAGDNPGNIGDVEYAAAANRASLITPVPGGVGPTTIAVLLNQTVAAAKRTIQAQLPQRSEERSG